MDRVETDMLGISPTTSTPSSLDLTPLPHAFTTLVGRDQDRDRLGAILRRPEVRLATVTGAGGVGKTRLGVAVAGSLADAFADGVAFVALGPVGDPALVIQTVAAAVGLGHVSGEVGLARAMAGRQVLLVLDNFEHLIGAAPAIAALLGACPGVKAVVTSRERLRIRGEREYPLTPLRLPSDAETPTPESVAGLEENPAVALFAERVRDVRPDFHLQMENAAAVVGICRRLDGLPLAIELAAARAKVLPLSALLTRLERRLPLLTDGPRDQPARQQTLERTIAWSYDLLAPDERALFRRLSVFVGGFTLDAADVVAGPGGAGRNDDATRAEDEGSSILDSLTSLVDKSLVRQEESGGEVRFVLLETVREYGLGRLAEHGETAATRGRHARWMLDLVGTTWDPPSKGQMRRALLDQFDDDLGNLRAALDWLEESRDTTAVMTLAGQTFWFWLMRSYRSEGRDRLERALGMPGAAESPAAVRALAYFGAASLERTRDDRERAIELVLRSLALFRDLGDRLGTAASVLLLGSFERGRGDLAAAATHISEAVALFETVESSSWVTLSRYNLGIVRLWQGDLPEAKRLLDLALAEYRSQDDAFGIAFVLIPLAFIAGERGDLAAAATYLAEDLERCRDLGTQEILLDALYGTAILAATAGWWVGATTILAATEARAASIGYSVEAPERARYDRAGDAARAALDPETWTTAQAAGHALALGETADAATGLLADIIAGGSAKALPAAIGATGPLSAREVEVIRLLAEGMSDRQIGEALFISHRTVMRHVTNILAKLEVPSRGAAGAWYVRQGS